MIPPFLERLRHDPGRGLVREDLHDNQTALAMNKAMVSCGCSMVSQSAESDLPRKWFHQDWMDFSFTIYFSIANQFFHIYIFFHGKTTIYISNWMTKNQSALLIYLISLYLAEFYWLKPGHQRTGRRSWRGSPAWILMRRFLKLWIRQGWGQLTSRDGW